MLRPIASRVTPLPLEFELSPIVQQGTIERRRNRKETFVAEKFDSSPVSSNNQKSSYSKSSGFTNLAEFTPVDLSTWIGGGKGANGTSLAPSGSGFSQWLRAGNSAVGEADEVKPAATSSSHGDSPPAVSHSPIGLPRDNTPSSLQRPDKHSQHSSLQNIQGDLNDILDRLQNMVANDGLLEGEKTLKNNDHFIHRHKIALSKSFYRTSRQPHNPISGSRTRVAESFSANDNCELKRAATEMEDLLTGLIEGMESRKGKLATVV